MSKDVLPHTKDKQFKKSNKKKKTDQGDVVAHERMLFS